MGLKMLDFFFFFAMICPHAVIWNIYMYVYFETIRFYVDFSTKLVTAERLLWERALKATVPLEEEDLSRQGLEAENAFVMVVAPVIEKLVSTEDNWVSFCLVCLVALQRWVLSSCSLGGGRNANEMNQSMLFSYRTGGGGCFGACTINRLLYCRDRANI